MSAIGSVVFSASDGYNAEVWDDSALIQEYDRAWKSSRELMRKRQEKSGGKKGRNWQTGDACRAVYSEDGEEYEGTVVFKNTVNRSVTVRFHGYNNEEEVKEKELMESLGQEEVDQQVEQARMDEEAEEEEEGAGDDFQLGDWCRAEWSVDGVVYEGIIESLDRKSRTAKVKFLGFGNVEEHSLDSLFLSKGEEWRAEQETIGKEVENGQGIREEDLHNLIAKNCPDLLANFGDAGDLGLESLEIGKRKKKEKKEKKDKKEKKHQKDREDKISSNLSGSSQSTSQFSPGQNQSTMSQPPSSQIPNWFNQPFNPPQAASQAHFSSFPLPLPPTLPPFLPYQDHFSNMYGVPSVPFQPQLMQPPSSLPPPPLTPKDDLLQSENSSALYSMLLSWYMAGYHTGVYEGRTQANGKRRKDKNK